MTKPSAKVPPAWLLYAITAAACWGIWGVLAKGPSRELSGWMTQVLFTFALIPSVIVACLSKQVKTGTNKPRGLFWGFIAGLIAAAGNIFFYLALENGAETSIQGIGILIAVAAIILLSGEARNLADPAAILKRIGLTPWMVYSFGAMVCWGVFSAVQKVSTNHVSAEMSYLAWCSAFVPVALWIVLTKPLNWNMSPAMVWSALAAGALNGFGVIAAFAAYRYEGKAAIVTPLAAAVQPIVTLLLAMIFLGERVGVFESFGIALAIVAAIALSQESKPVKASQPVKSTE